MTLILTAPSKTFLLGEYLVLHGGPALIACTAPCFTLQVRDAPHFDLEGIHPDSPAGRFLTDHQGLLNHSRVIFTDPHQGAGGLGASSAQFLLAYRAVYQWKAQEVWCHHAASRKTLLATYQHYAWDGQGFSPSGADVIAQTGGQLAWYDKQADVLERVAWPFEEMGFLLLKTQEKIATHEHLRQLGDFSIAGLAEVMQQAKQAWAVRDSQGFCQAVVHYSQELIALGFCHESTQRWLSAIADQTPRLAAKGCGAMGADTVFIVAPKDTLPLLKNWVKQRKLSVIGSEKTLISSHEDHG